jgi:DnaK suppressor protein
VSRPGVRQVLAERLASLEGELASLMEVSPGSGVSFGKRIGDGTTEAVERLSKVGAARELAALKADVVRALQKLDDGTYGLCDRCGLSIADERLEARPASVLCVRCASALV